MARLKAGVGSGTVKEAEELLSHVLGTSGACTMHSVSKELELLSSSVHGEQEGLCVRHP